MKNLLQALSFEAEKQKAAGLFFLPLLKLVKLYMFNTPAWR
jgi:hypothetical protein